MATQLIKIGSPKNGQQQQLKEKVRFEMDSAEGEEDGQTADGREQPILLGSVKERFAGFFELPERCVPFGTAPFDEENTDQGFPTVIDLKVNAMSDSKEESTTNQRQKGKSLFAQHFDQIAQKEEKNNLEVKTEEGIVDRNVKNLELMPTQKSQKGTDHHSNRTDTDLTGRYAIDPVHTDFAIKCLRHVVSRQEQQLVKLFDTLAMPESYSNSIPNEKVRILEEAKRSIRLIRPLYLEQIRSEESGRIVWQFARRFVDPFSDGAWTLSPIRNVLDAVQQRSSAITTTDDIEIVRLTLLWTVLFFLQRPIFFSASVSISEFFCRLAEIYLLGPEMFLYDLQIRNCVSLLINDFLFDACQKGLMAIHLNQPIASLDQFMPFYEDLLQQFEDVSAGDDNFALLLLIGAYLNSSRTDGLLMAQTLWSPKRNVVRQIILSEEKTLPFISFAFADNRSLGMEGTDEEKHTNEAMAKLMANYACALEEGTVVKGRNAGIFAIAIAELKQFIGQNEAGEGNEFPSQLLKGLQETVSKFS